MPNPLQTDDYRGFIARLRSHRIQLGITQDAVATKLGQPQSYVSKTERCERRLDVIEFVAWAQALDEEPEPLLKLLRA